MYLTLTLVIACAAVFVLFSQEFLELFKKLFAIKGMNIFLPLALASLLIIHYQYWCVWLVYQCSLLIYTNITVLSRFIPLPIAQILFLTLISTLPVFLLNLWYKKRTRRAYAYPYVTSTLIWVTTAMIIFATR